MVYNCVDIIAFFMVTNNSQGAIITIINKKPLHSIACRAVVKLIICTYRHIRQSVPEFRAFLTQCRKF